MEDVEVVLLKNWMRRKAVEELVRVRLAQKAADKRWRRYNRLCNAVHIITGAVALVSTVFVLMGAVVPAMVGCSVTGILAVIARLVQDRREEVCW